MEARRGLTEWERKGLSEEERVWREEEEARSRGEKFLWWLDDNERAMLEKFNQRKAGGGVREVEERLDVVVRREGEEVEGRGEVDEDETARQRREEAAQQAQQQQQQHKT